MYVWGGGGQVAAPGAQRVRLLLDWTLMGGDLCSLVGVHEGIP